MTSEDYTGLEATVGQGQTKGVLNVLEHYLAIVYVYCHGCVLDIVRICRSCFILVQVSRRIMFSFRSWCSMAPERPAGVVATCLSTWKWYRKNVQAREREVGRRVRTGKGCAWAQDVTAACCTGAMKCAKHSSSRYEKQMSCRAVSKQS